ncbi:alpha/beta fold hydrolase [Streptomyces uncialis]|uniref:alpha/beta fold hydrolase n=1 Tax=Streptomyces uncialis TaxID=1048205 RepID=UPI00382E2BC2
MAPVLARSWRVYALDLRGHGRSDWPGGYSLQLMRDDVLGFLDALALGRVDLMGHSMGGVVAHLFAGEHPQRMDRLVLEDVPVPRPRGAFTPVRPDGELTFDWEMVLAVRRQVDTPDPKWLESLSKITAETLAVAGGPESHVPREGIAELARRVPQGRVVTIPAGHRPRYAGMAPPRWPWQTPGACRPRYAGMVYSRASLARRRAGTRKATISGMGGRAQRTRPGWIALTRICWSLISYITGRSRRGYAGRRRCRTLRPGGGCQSSPRRSGRIRARPPGGGCSVCGAILTGLACCESRSARAGSARGGEERRCSRPGRPRPPTKQQGCRAARAACPRRGVRRTSPPQGCRAGPAGSPTRCRWWCSRPGSGAWACCSPRTSVVGRSRTGR